MVKLKIRRVKEREKYASKKSELAPVVLLFIRYGGTVFNYGLNYQRGLAIKIQEQVPRLSPGSRRRLALVHSVLRTVGIGIGRNELNDGSCEHEHLRKLLI